MNLEFSDDKLKYRRGMVRPCVTYGILGFFILFTAIVGVSVLFFDKKISSELLTIYTGLSTLTASIVSFWFGGRGVQQDKSPNSIKQTGQTGQ